MASINSLLVGAYNVSECVIQAGVHVILRDFTNYYWNKEIEESELQLTPATSEIFHDLHQNENCHLITPKDEESEILRPQLGAEISLNDFDGLQFDNNLDSEVDLLPIKGYAFDQLKDNIDVNEENEKEYIKELNILPEINPENSHIISESVLNLCSENEETLSESIENEDSLTNMQVCKSFPDTHSDNSHVLDYNENIENSSLLDENNKIVMSLLNDYLEELPTLYYKEENLIESIIKYALLSNIDKNSLDLKSYTNILNELEDFPERDSSSSDARDNHNSYQIVAVQHELYSGEPLQNTNLSDKDNINISRFENNSVESHLVHSDGEHFFENTVNDESLLNVVKKTPEFSQLVDDFREPIKNSKPIYESNPSTLSDCVKKLLTKKENLLKESENDESLQNTLKICREPKPHPEATVGQNEIKYPECHYCEPVEIGNYTLGYQSTQKHTAIGIDCFWEDEYTHTYLNAGAPGEHKCDCLLKHGCLQVVSSDDDEVLTDDQEFLTHDQLESVETGSVSDWLFSVNPHNYRQPDFVMNNSSQETLNVHSDDPQLDFEDDIDIHEHYIKTQFVKNWLDEKDNSFQNSYGCGDYNEF